MLNIKHTIKEIDIHRVSEEFIDRLNENQGIFLSSGTEYPNRYSRWDIGFLNPPFGLNATANGVTLEAFNKKGVEIIKLLHNEIKDHKEIETQAIEERKISYKVIKSSKIFSEEERSHQPSAFSVLRYLLQALPDNVPTLGAYGVFGYDLLFEFDAQELRHARNDSNYLYRLMFPDNVFKVDRQRDQAFSYEFEYVGVSETDTTPFNPVNNTYDENFKSSPIVSDMSDEDYSKLVVQAKDHMAKGNIVELVLRRTFSTEYKAKPTTLFKKMQEMNPSPYMYLVQFGDEQVIGASPEMFVRVTGKRIESCPISGTIARSHDVMVDIDRIKDLLNSDKDEIELTMCTDVDRNDKSRVCKAGSVKLLSRRQIEAYQGLFHTVDHVEGTLREGFDGLDGFLSHMWAVTLMGAPKPIASRLIEKYEVSPRGYYGGAVGAILANGDVNTGIAIRTVHVKNKIAYYGAGASLVYDSDPESETKETRLKSNTFFKVMGQYKDSHKDVDKISAYDFTPFAQDKRIIFLDHEDSFVHTLANYFRQTGAKVETFRSDIDIKKIIELKPDLIVYSPGPQMPKDFHMLEKILEVSKHNIPQFGICLGLQGIFEAFGGSLKYLDEPHQGKRWLINHTDQGIFKGMEREFTGAGYHAIIGDPSNIPKDLIITAKEKESGHIMAIAHKSLPIQAVQFHPESILTLENKVGLRLIFNVVKTLCKL